MDFLKQCSKLCLNHVFVALPLVLPTFISHAACLLLNSLFGMSSLGVTEALFKAIPFLESAKADVSVTIFRSSAVPGYDWY